MSKDKLPTVTSQVSPDLRKWIDRVREMLVGNSRSRFVRLDELENAGVVGVDSNDNVTDPNGDPGNNNDVDIPVLRPPQPTGLEAFGAIEYMTLDWDTPTYYGHSFTEVWRSETNDISTAEFLYQTQANVISDLVGPGATYYYWVRFVNILGVEGPFSDSANDTTGYQVGPLLEALTGEITTGQLVTTFANTIANIEGEYVIKADINGIASGFAFVATSTPDGGVTSEFGILADRFFVLPEITFNQTGTPSATASGQVWKKGGEFFISQGTGTDKWEPLLVPFAVVTTPTTTPDGDPIPAGVYIDQALIKNASIDNAKIARLAVDTAKIADLAVTNAKVANLDAQKVTTGVLQSRGFQNTAGRAGWYLALGTNAAGNQEDVQFIIRSSEYDGVAMELRPDGSFFIRGLVIGDKIQSATWPTRGFLFDIDNNTFELRDENGATIMATNGINKDAISESIGREIDVLLDEVDTSTEDITTINTTTIPGIDGRLDTIETEDIPAINTAIGTLNNDLNGIGGTDDVARAAQALANQINTNISPFVRDINGNVIGLNPDTITIKKGSGEELAALAFVSYFASKADVDTYFSSVAIVEAIIGNLIVGNANIANASISQGKIANLVVDTLDIAGEAVTVPQVLQLPFSPWSVEDTEVIVNSTPLVVQYATASDNPSLIPSKVIILVTAEIGSEGFGSDWAAATIRLRYFTGVKSVISTVVSSSVVEALQQNARKGGPPSIVFTVAIDGWVGARSFFLTLETNKEQSGTTTGWWRVGGGTITVLGAKR